MVYFLSIVYKILDIVCVLIFLGAFASRRFTGVRHWALAGLYIASDLGIMLLYISFFEYNVLSEIVLTFLCGIVFCRILYTNISFVYLALVLILEDIIAYTTSFIGLYIAVFVCGTSVQAFQQSEATPYIIFSVIESFLEVSLMLMIRKIIKDRNQLKNNLKQNSAHIMLYLTFPVASFTMLLTLLRITSRQGLSDEFVIGCSWMIFIANAAILYLLDQMEKQRRNHEILLTLEQQLQLQAKNMETICNLYSTQRRQVHDFRTHINTINQLLRDQQYDQLSKYMQSLIKDQDRNLAFVRCGNPVLDILFNSKASAAKSKEIDIHFNITDLADLPFDSVDLIVLLSNLIDNAIEACEKCTEKRSILISAIKESSFKFVIRNTSLPVRIVGNDIATTKPDSYMHGFGLSNIKMIIDKYCGEYSMTYNENVFSFILEIPLL